MTLPNVDIIRKALEADEAQAVASLRAATNVAELIDAWFADAEHFSGPPRERLQDIYSEVLARFVPLARAG